MAKDSPNHDGVTCAEWGTFEIRHGAWNWFALEPSSELTSAVWMKIDRAPVM